jgi:hypothetical protein
VRFVMAHGEGRLVTDSSSNTAQHKRCTCNFCKTIHAVQRIQKKLSVREAHVLERLLEDWEAASTDASYYKMKYEGKWPGDAP